MEAVGQMTGGVAHDFNNILTVILGNLEFLSAKDNTDDDSGLIANSMAAVERAADLTRHLLAFSRKQQLEPQLLDIGEHVERMAQLLKRTLGERIALRTDVEPGLWACVADPAQLESAIMNLCINARDAMPAGGELTIECRNVSADSASDARPADISEGEYVVISITDTGQGMAPETLTRALEPFFTTKDVGHGSGLGLAMIYGFAKQSGGDVALESEEGRGTTVNLYLPRAVKTARLVQKEKKQAVLPGGGETILVIEDDPDVRKLIIHMLQEMTYIVIDVPDVAGARDVLDGRDRVDLVLSDVILPGGTSGPQFADQMKERRPGLKFIFMSGYSPEAAMGAGFLTSGNTLLKKPFQRQQLAAAVREGFDVEIAPSPQSSGTGIAS